METSLNERHQLVAPCGIDCGICELYMACHDEKLMNYLISKGIPKAVLPCEGCKPNGGHCPIHPGECATYTCAQEKEVEHCVDCTDFPCPMLHPAADRAEVLPHNLKVFNLCTIKRDGINEFVKDSAIIKKTYYKGEMVIGQGPVLKN